VTTAVVFAYGDVGVRCLAVLLEQGVEVKLVVTHLDDPEENRWYASVEQFARERALPCVAPTALDDKLLYRLTSLAPDFIFSFYYRNLLPRAVLLAARRGALNLHGSLLPRFRGRAPVNWAVLRGATETGATLHYMVDRADAGDIVDQEAVPILADETAHDVFVKIACAAQLVLDRSLPRLIDGTAPRRPQNLAEGEYCGRRRPEDGRIDWSRPAREIHNLVRAVAPPFPGAFAWVGTQRWMIDRTQVLPAAPHSNAQRLVLYADADRCAVTCLDGERLCVLAARDEQGPVDLAAFAARLAHVTLRVS
jgi:methionyl-tRNA formyltransferase